jgi:hypothetical protein
MPVRTLSEFQVRPAVLSAARGGSTSPLRDVIVDILLRCYAGESEPHETLENEYQAKWLSSADMLQPIALRLDDVEEEEKEGEEEEEEEEEIEEEDLGDSSTQSETDSSTFDESA